MQRALRGMVAVTAVVVVLCATAFGFALNTIRAFFVYPTLVQIEAGTRLSQAKYDNAQFWFVVSIVIALLIVGFCLWRMSRPGVWRLDRGFGAWRSTKWILFAFISSIALTSMPSVSMEIGTQRILPIYDVDYPLLVATWLPGEVLMAPVILGLGMFGVDTVLKRRSPRREAVLREG